MKVSIAGSPNGGVLDQQYINKLYTILKQ